MADGQQMAHSLSLRERTALSVTGVLEVISFDENCVVLKTALGILAVQGQQLQLKTLSPEGGNVTVQGDIAAISYEEPRQTGWLSRFFR